MFSITTSGRETVNTSQPGQNFTDGLEVKQERFAKRLRGAA